MTLRKKINGLTNDVADRDAEILDLRERLNGLESMYVAKSETQEDETMWEDLDDDLVRLDVSSSSPQTHLCI